MSLPNAVLLNTVGQYFTPFDAAKAPSVSRSWRELFSSDAIWKKVLLNLEGGTFSDPHSNRNKDELEQIAHAKWGRRLMDIQRTDRLKDEVTLTAKEKVLKLIGLIHVPIFIGDPFLFSGRKRRGGEMKMSDDYIKAFTKAKEYIKKNITKIKNRLSKGMDPLEREEEIALRAVTYTYNQAKESLPQYVVEMNDIYNRKNSVLVDKKDNDPGDGKNSVSTNKNNVSMSRFALRAVTSYTYNQAKEFVPQYDVERNDIDNRKYSAPVDRKDNDPGDGKNSVSTNKNNVSMSREDTFLVGGKSHRECLDRECLDRECLDRIRIVLVIALVALGIKVVEYI